MRINFLAASLVQVGIAKGFKPAIISGWPGRAGLAFLCRLATVPVVLLGTSMINTPARIAWYADRLPWLSYLKENASVMAEYGYLYRDEEIGIFRSRLSPQELKKTDQGRAGEAAKILNRFEDSATYQGFLEIYTPMTDPFLHEARVHLFSRDHHFSTAMRYKDDAKTYAEHLTVAVRENQIMENYFPNTLRHSAYFWSADKCALAQNHLLKNKIYESRVSRELITRVSEGEIACFFALLLIGFVSSHWYLLRDKSGGHSLESATPAGPE